MIQLCVYVCVNCIELCACVSVCMYVIWIQLPFKEIIYKENKCFEVATVWLSSILAKDLIKM